MTDALSIFKTFLKSQPDLKIVDKDSVRGLLEANWSQFNESLMRGIVAKSLEHRDKQLALGKPESELLGTWGVVIDEMNRMTQIRASIAQQKLEMIVDEGRQIYPDPEMKGLVNADECLKILQKKLTDTYNTIYDDGNEIDFSSTNLLLYTFETAASMKNWTIVDIIYVIILQFYNKILYFNKDLSTIVPKVMSQRRGDLVTPMEPAPTAVTNATPTVATGFDGGVDNKEEKDIQRELVAAGIRLKVMMTECAGDVAKLRLKAVEGVREGKIGAPFLRVLTDNIEACESAGYVNKVKVLNYLRGLVEEAMQAITEAVASGDGDDESNTGNANSTYHAPQFLDPVTDTETSYSSGEDTDLTGGKASPGGEASAPESFIDLKGDNVLDGVLKDKSANAKKKAVKKAKQQKVRAVASAVGQHLEEHGWAVCDNFLPLDLIRRVRIEAGIFQECYEHSEIWVGKKADVGAHLQVPSVRGDKVLWMCGGHRAAPEGVTRMVRTKGEMEPCRLDVKAQAPMRKFGGMKELVDATDKLMDELKLQVERLGGIFERSDAMLAVYPGNGARFARHIDNTTGDGRRLTLLIYLNPDWDRSDGGALRLTPPSSDHPIDVYPEAGRLAMFYSADCPHEVMPCYADRHAITVWYYDTAERVQALKDAEENGSAAAAASTTPEQQTEAKEFIGILMGGDEVSADGGSVTQEELESLRTAVRDLSSEAVGIVAGITGAPSPDSFREGFKLLKPDDVVNMRKLFRRMGLQ